MEVISVVGSGIISLMPSGNEILEIFLPLSLATLALAYWCLIPNTCVVLTFYRTRKRLVLPSVMDCENKLGIQSNTNVTHCMHTEVHIYSFYSLFVPRVIRSCSDTFLKVGVIRAK